jgi:hypothetical protein
MRAARLVRAVRAAFVAVYQDQLSGDSENWAGGDSEIWSRL